MEAHRTKALGAEIEPERLERLVAEILRRARHVLARRRRCREVPPIVPPPDEAWRTPVREPAGTWPRDRSRSGGATNDRRGLLLGLVLLSVYLVGVLSGAVAQRLVRPANDPSAIPWNGGTFHPMEVPDGAEPAPIFLTAAPGRGSRTGRWRTAGRTGGAGSWGW